MRFTVEYTFIENGHACRTAWCGPANSVKDAVRVSSEWYGFEKDGVEVTGINVTDDAGNEYKVK